MTQQSKRKRGRPPEGRVPLTVHILPEAIAAIDGEIKHSDKARNSRGKIIESKFLK